MLLVDPSGEINNVDTQQAVLEQHIHDAAILDKSEHILQSELVKENKKFAAIRKKNSLGDDTYINIEDLTSEDLERPDVLEKRNELLKLEVYGRNLKQIRSGGS